jgi:hypothetical protein
MPPPAALLLFIGCYLFALVRAGKRQQNTDKAAEQQAGRECVHNLFRYH